MKTFFLALCLMIGFNYACLAQTSAPTEVAKKFNGQSTTLSFDYDAADEALITHFELKWTDELTKTTIFLKSIPKSSRSTTIAAFYSAGFSMTYLNVFAVNSNSPVWVSDPSNTVAIQRIGKPVTNLRF